MHSTELRRPLLKPLHCSSGPCSITDFQGPGNRIIRRSSPTTSTAPCPCAWPIPSTRRPAVPLACVCPSGEGGRRPARASWDPGALLAGACLSRRGCPRRQDTTWRLRDRDTLLDGRYKATKKILTSPTPKRQLSLWNCPHSRLRIGIYYRLRTRD